MNAQWDALVRYAADGTLEIDNLTAERALRGIAVGRKNSHDRLSSAQAYVSLLQPSVSGSTEL
jgi:hypothetical protein